MSEPTVAALAAMKAPANGTPFLLTGYYADGDMPPQRYVYATAACAAADGGSQISITAGGCAKLAAPNSMRITTAMFGDKGDGTYDFSTGAITGTDDTAAIQHAIDYAIQAGIPVVEMSPFGGHKTTDTIQLGYGEAFHTIGLIAQGNPRAGYEKIAGAYALLPTKTDRCAVNIQGGRDDFIRGLEILGQNFPYVATLIQSAPYPMTASGWLDPSLAASGTTPGGLQPYSPYAGICVDAYAGTAPTASYPTVTYPSWTGLDTQYGKLTSSDNSFSDLYIGGFAVNIVISPNNVASMGDFTKFTASTCAHAVYCFGDGTNQSRNVRIADLYTPGFYTVITNMDFGGAAAGSAGGVLEGPIDNIGGGEVYQMFRLEYGNPLYENIAHIYCEACVRIGTITGVGGAALTGTVTITGLHYFVGDTGSVATGIIPAAMIDGQNIALTLNDVSFQGYSRMLNLFLDDASNGGRLTVNGGSWIGGGKLQSLFGPGAAVQAAMNYTGGVFVGGADGDIAGHLTWQTPTRGTYFATASAAPTGQWLDADPVFGASTPARVNYTEAMAARGGGFVDALNHRRWTWAVGPIGFAGRFSNPAIFLHPPSYTSCDVISFTATAIDAKVGQIMYHPQTGTVFIVTSITGGNRAHSVTARQMNNMTVDVRSGACLLSFVTARQLIAGGGMAEFYNTDVVISSRVTFGTFNRRSTIVSNVNEGNGPGGSVSTYLRPGDVFYGYRFPDTYFQWPFRTGTTITAVNNGKRTSSRGSTITLSAKPLINGRFPLLPLPVVGGPQ